VYDVYISNHASLEIAEQSYVSYFGTGSKNILTEQDTERCSC